MRAWHPIAVVVAAVLGYGFLTINWDRPPVQSVQEGYRGLGMVQTTNLRRYLANPAVDKLPAVDSQRSRREDRRRARRTRT